MNDVIILCGGKGTRLSEETVDKPKPMIEIGGKPILWHIMKIYSEHGINDFIICCGYKSYIIKEYFLNYRYHTSDITVNLTSNEIEVHRRRSEPWNISLIDTGESTMTGGRLKRVSDYLDNDDFCFTYGDGVADIDISASVNFHKSHGKLATITAVQPPGRYGALELNGSAVNGFREKPKGDGVELEASLDEFVKTLNEVQGAVAILLPKEWTSSTFLTPQVQPSLNAGELKTKRFIQALVVWM